MRSTMICHFVRTALLELLSGKLFKSARTESAKSLNYVTGVLILSDGVQRDTEKVNLAQADRLSTVSRLTRSNSPIILFALF